MKRGEFNLTKFITNSESVFESPHEDVAFANPSFSDVGSVSVLGFNWETPDDTFSVSRGVSNALPAKFTQRKILSSVSSVYDPLEIVAPFTIRGRLMLKELWCCICQSWDTVVPQNINDLFHEWNGEKDVIPNVKLARCVFTQSSHSNIELHTFVDASQAAMCVVVYVRSMCNKEVLVNFVVGKFCVAPIRSNTIPKLELQAALFGMRLCTAAKSFLPFDVEPCWFWSNSSTVIHWIHSSQKNSLFS